MRKYMSWWLTLYRTLAAACVVAALNTFAESSAWAAAKAKFTTFSVAGSVQTEVSGLNDQNAVTGTYEDRKGYYHAFLRTADGTVTTFDAPGAVGVTAGAAINDAGVIAGDYIDSTGLVHGFVRSFDGNITGFLVYVDTYVSAINSSGAVIGTYHDSDNPPNAFLRALDGTITTFTPPGSTATETGGINDKGAIAGYYDDANGLAHGFIRNPDGTFISFDDPKASGVTEGQTINNAGVVAGTSYWDGYKNQYHGFMRAADGTFTEFDPPGSTQTNCGIVNKQGEIVGSYSDAGTEGFLRTKDGTITTFVPRGARPAPFVHVVGFNNRGTIAGWYNDKSGVARSYLLEDK